MAAYEFSKYKWGSTVFGTSGGQVTWSFAATSGAYFAFDAAITNGTFQDLVRAAFDRWEDVANIDFVEVPDSSASDVRLGWDAIDGSYNTIGQAQYSYYVTPTDYREISKAEIRFDTAESWSTSPQAVLAGQVNFYSVALHEIGHAIGLAHSDDPNTIMFSELSKQTDLTTWDITGAQLLYGAAPAQIYPTAYVGTSGPDRYVGNPADESIQGLAGNDILAGDGGNDRIDGGAGLDFVLYDHDRLLYRVDRQSDGELDLLDLTSQADEGRDTLINVERLSFSDGYLAFDLEGNAGEAYRLYQAAFDRQPDIAGLGFWIRQLDAGRDLNTVAADFLFSDEFRETYGSARSITDALFLDLIYENVLHRDPDAGGASYWMGQLERGAEREWVLASFSESQENRQNVAGQIDDGIWYI